MKKLPLALAFASGAAATAVAAYFHLDQKLRNARVIYHDVGYQTAASKARGDTPAQTEALRQSMLKDAGVSK